MNSALKLLLVALGALVVTGCGSRSLDSLDPELAKDAAGNVAPLTIDLVDYRQQPPLRFTLSNVSNGRAQRAQKAGRLPLTHKIVSDETSGQLVAFMREQGFFGFARPVGNTETALPDKTRRTLMLVRGGQASVRMVELHGMGQSGGRDQVKAMSEMSRVIRTVCNQTLALRIDPSGKSMTDLMNQPGLRRGGR